jgi:hypothetical protein
MGAGVRTGASCGIGGDAGTEHSKKKQRRKTIVTHVKSQQTSMIAWPTDLDPLPTVNHSLTDPASVDGSVVVEMSAVVVWVD